MISAKNFLGRVKSGGDLFIMDLRSAQDYAKGHVKGAVNGIGSTDAKTGWLGEGYALVTE